MDGEGQDAVQNEMWSRTHDQRFCLAEQAPLCNGWLRGEFGHLAMSKSSREVLEGSHAHHPAFDEATRSLLEECTIIHKLVPANSVSTTICRPAWQWRWLCTKERTSSSISGMHFGHYKATAKSDKKSKLLLQKMMVIAQIGSPLER